MSPAGQAPAGAPDGDVGEEAGAPTVDRFDPSAQPAAYDVDDGLAYPLAYERETGVEDAA